MVDDLEVGRWFGPVFRKQPDSPPQSTFEQQTTQPGDALVQYAYDSSWSARSRRQHLRRRSEAIWGSAQIIGVFDSGPICQCQQCCHSQHQPVTADSSGVGPSSLLPLPPDTLERLEAQLYPEAQCIPAHTCFSRAEIELVSNVVENTFPGYVLIRLLWQSPHSVGARSGHRPRTSLHPSAASSGSVPHTMAASGRQAF